MTKRQARTDIDSALAHIKELRKNEPKLNAYIKLKLDVIVEHLKDAQSELKGRESDPEPQQ